MGATQCPGCFRAYIVVSQDPSDSKSSRFHVDICQFCVLHSFEVYSINSSKMIGKFHEVLNFNRLFFELDRFICNEPPVLPRHRCNQSKRVKTMEPDIITLSSIYQFTLKTLVWVHQNVSLFQRFGIMPSINHLRDQQCLHILGNPPGKTS